MKPRTASAINFAARLIIVAFASPVIALIVAIDAVIRFVAIIIGCLKGAPATEAMARRSRPATITHHEGSGAVH